MALMHDPDGHQGDSQCELVKSGGLATQARGDPSCCSRHRGRRRAFRGAREVLLEVNRSTTQDFFAFDHEEQEDQDFSWCSSDEDSYVLGERRGFKLAEKLDSGQGQMPKSKEPDESTNSSKGSISNVGSPTAACSSSCSTCEPRDATGSGPNPLSGSSSSSCSASGFHARGGMCLGASMGPIIGNSCGAGACQEEQAATPELHVGTERSNDGGDISTKRCHAGPRPPSGPAPGINSKRPVRVSVTSSGATPLVATTPDTASPSALVPRPPDCPPSGTRRGRRLHSGQS